MKNDKTKSDDELVFLDDGETSNAEGEPIAQKWKVVIVDDDESVHAVTRMILGDFTFNNRGLELISAYTDEEAYDILSKTEDIALILLDVVMAEEDSGLKIARYVREELGNRLTRIVLRTGQPGQAPEKRVIVDYDINDYKLKTELTADKLFVTMVSSLRSYNDLMMLEYSRRGLERIVDSSASLFRQRSFSEFISGVLIQITSLMSLDRSAIYCRTSGLSARKDDGEFIVEAGTGDFVDCERKRIEAVLPPETVAQIKRAANERNSVFLTNSFIAYFTSAGGTENVIFMKTTNGISDWDRNLIEIFCTNISVALDNMELNLEIEKTQKEIVFTLGEIAEARSRETGHHVKRVAEYSKIIALRAGLEERDADILRMAAPMHDVGKLTIPDAILNKPGLLTTEEFNLIKTHAQAGYDILKNSHREILKLAALIALEHQEKFDGSGYPFGKAGEEISVYGRIVAIADVFDALGCDRVYKKAWDLPRILAYFREQRGKHFDPFLTDKFIDGIDEIMEIRKRFPD